MDPKNPVVKLSAMDQWDHGQLEDDVQISTASRKQSEGTSAFLGLKM